MLPAVDICVDICVDNGHWHQQALCGPMSLVHSGAVTREREWVNSLGENIVMDQILFVKISLAILLTVTRVPKRTKRR